jgi:hypothetical protein
MLFNQIRDQAIRVLADELTYVRIGLCHIYIRPALAAERVELNRVQRVPGPTPRVEARATSTTTSRWDFIVRGDTAMSSKWPICQWW